MYDRNACRGDLELARIEFLDSELQISQTFLDVAELEAGHPQRRSLAIYNALRGYETALSWLGAVQSGEELERLSAKLIQLAQRLERVPESYPGLV